MTDEIEKKNQNWIEEKNMFSRIGGSVSELPIFWGGFLWKSSIFHPIKLPFDTKVAKKSQMFPNNKLKKKK